MACLVNIFIVRINSLSSFHWAVRCVQESHPKRFRDSLTMYRSDNAYIIQPHAANHYRLLSHVTLCLFECSK